MIIYLSVKLISLMNMVILIFMLLISVAFLTLLERKLLSIIQWRKGPNKVGVIGLIQPFSDAIKLLSKEINLMSFNKFMYMFMPLMMFFLMMLLWVFTEMNIDKGIFNWSILLILCIISVGVYPILIGGWFSKSTYSILGALRCIAQTISYEVSLIIIIIVILIYSEGYSFEDLMNYQSKNNVFLLFLMPMGIILFFSMMVELNRTPMDLIEGESELVSGFNVEYYSSLFAMIFLGEYGMIIFMMFIFEVVFLGHKMYSIVFNIILMMLTLVIILVRGVLPRLRYDELMYFCWKVILPISLMYLYMSVFFKVILFKLI